MSALNVTNPMQSYSQYGEDLILWDYFEGRPDGLFVEVGANHPTVLNNTWFFEQRGWRGILVEPLPERCRELRQVRHRSQIIEAALGAPENRGTTAFQVAAEHALSGLELKPDVKCLEGIKVTLTTLDDVMAAAGNPKIDFITIDVEGTELDVLRGFNLERHRPPVLLVEDHWRNHALHQHLCGRDYRIVRRTGVNSWYVPADAKVFPATPFGAFKTSVSARYTLLRRRIRGQWRSLFTGRGRADHIPRCV
jgi:FkbM family methyltransferase